MTKHSIGQVVQDKKQQQLYALIRQGMKPCSTAKLKKLGTELGLLLYKNPRLLQKAKLSRQMKADAIALIIRSSNKTVIDNTKALMNMLSFANFAKAKPTQKKLSSAVDFAIEIHNSKLFQTLLEHPLSVSDSSLKSLIQSFYPDAGNLMMWDLFYKLDPKRYQGRSYGQLSPYEKLYFSLYEPYYIHELNHRLNLPGKAEIKWDKAKLDEISLEGQNAGFSLRQFKEHLLLFAVKHPNKLSEGFNRAVDEIVNLLPQSGKHTLNGELFYFNHVNHGWCAILLDDKLYMINMGLGSKAPGIQVYDVPHHKKASVLNDLKSWEKTDLLDQIQITDEEMRNPAKLQDKIARVMEFNDFKDFSKKHHLTQLEQIDIPAQTMGNCSYYSLKGLLLAISYHYNKKQYSSKIAYNRSLSDVLSYIHYDYANAIDDYMAHSIKPNLLLLKQAKEQAKKYETVKGSHHVEPTLDWAAYKRKSARQR
ncbi:hypothetical protein [Candidatus Berkiella aquae]|uniref:Uncharacterized protein n=1 Tax=Candidatus Berkiella aquae TaxID=295108 RepID=A0A0Q9YKS3_9GAMM|nr:hypothetical protein [Candidatus Berkiella aquae]MCS5710907.1 hypothetical protein [Candidatus Berkiella aquae]